MLEHWQAGRSDTQRMLRSSPWLQPLADDIRVRVFDLARESGTGKEDVS
jgi:hypothetical protein